MECLGSYPFVCKTLLVKNKKGKVVDTKYKLNPAFQRIIYVSKTTNKAVSDILEIEDKYEAFCINETALFISAKLSQKPEEDGNKILKTLSKAK